MLLFSYRHMNMKYRDLVLSLYHRPSLAHRCLRLASVTQIDRERITTSLSALRLLLGSLEAKGEDFSVVEPNQYNDRIRTRPCRSTELHYKRCLRLVNSHNAHSDIIIRDVAAGKWNSSTSRLSVSMRKG